jgi:SAM-dependent methyltransferase
MQDLAQGTWNYPVAKFPRKIKTVGEYTPFERFLDRLLPAAAPGATSFEAGVWPASFQHLFQNKGYILNGIDIADSTAALADHLRGAGFQVGAFHAGDFLAFAKGSPERHDVVASFGFIEHFTPLDEVLALHARLVKPGGLLLVSTPNFTHGVQYWLHRIFDRANLDRHCLTSMNPRLWARILKRLGGFAVLEAGYVDFMHLWYEDNRHTPWKDFVSKKAREIGARFPRSKYFSPFCYLLARKTAAD